MSIGADSFGDSLDARGRHRRNGAGTWTPAVSTHPDHGRHELHSDNPFYPSASGSLPRAERQTGPVKTDYGFLPIRGELPLPRPPAPRPLRRPATPLPQPRAEELTAETPVVAPPEPSIEQPIRRTKVKLTQPVKPPRREEDDVRVYLAPEPDGLGTFDLGSVPASVTPPKSWKKAAWFATISSGGVVVALLFAGSLLVGAPTENQSSNQGWPGYRGGQPSISDDQKTLPPPTGAAAKPSGGGGKNQASAEDHRNVVAGAPREGGAMPPAAPANGGGAPEMTGAPSPRMPQKPPIAPAPRVTPTTAPWYSFPLDSQTMGDNTEKFFNTVAEDPNAASSVTTGKLHDQGPQALAQKYADVAYFEVKKISIDQNRGVTINTVEVTHKDGSKTLETRQLTFGDDAKIESDNR